LLRFPYLPNNRHCVRREILASILAGMSSAAVASKAAAGATEPDTAAALVGAFDRLFAGPYNHLRAVHAKGLVCTGVFTPSDAASTLSYAPHFAGPDVAIQVRFSNFAAVPGMPDGHPAASPRGMAVKFMLAEGVETDIVAHSYNGFPAATPQDFLQFLQALTDASALAELAAAKRVVRHFLLHPKPTPASYASENYFGVTALVFTNAQGLRQAARYRLVPAEAPNWLNAEQAEAREPDFLATELRTRLAKAPAQFHLQAQLAHQGDRTDDGSQPWPDDRLCVTLGTLNLRQFVDDPDLAGTGLRFTPVSLVPGIEPSDDPMLLSRTLSYSISAERRLQP
jgi:catalase